MTKKDWSSIALLSLLSALCLFPLLGNFGIFDPSDGWYSEGAREMLELGNYMTPHLYYQPWHEKPIMVYWLIIASYKLFGVSEFAARVPSALCASLLVVGIFVFCRQFTSRRTALASALVLLSSPLFLVVGHFALTDMPLALFVSTSAALFFSALNTNKPWLIYPGYAVAGLAVLTKGPIALFLIGIGLLLYMIVTSKSISEFFKSVFKLNPIVGAIIVLAIALPWFVGETIITKGAFYEEFFVKQNLARIKGTLDHLLPFWFYIPVVFGGCFPWSLFGFGAAFEVINRLKQRLNQDPTTSLLIFSALAGLSIFLFFSSVPSKLPTYIIPSLPPFAIVLGIYIDVLLERHKAKTIAWTAPVLVILALAAPFVLTKVFQNQVAPFLSLTPVILVLALIWIAYGVLVIRNQLKPAMILLAASALIGGGIIVPNALVIYQRNYLKDFQDFVIWCKQNQIHPMVFTSLKPSASFYAGYAIPPIKSDTDFMKLLIDSPNEILVLMANNKLDYLRQLPVKTNTRVLRHEGNWNLVAVSLVRP